MPITELTFTNVLRAADWSQAINPLNAAPACVSSIGGLCLLTLAILGGAAFLIALSRKVAFVRLHVLIAIASLLIPVAMAQIGIAAANRVLHFNGVPVNPDELRIGATEVAGVVVLGGLICLLNVVFLLAEFFNRKQPIGIPKSPKLAPVARVAPHMGAF